MIAKIIAMDIALLTHRTMSRLEAYSTIETILGSL